MAACVPARSGERVLEAGVGSGAGLLCLAARVPDLRGVGVEQDGELAELARRNVARNGFDGIEIVAGRIENFGDTVSFDHAMANPPWFAPAATPSPDPARVVARHKAEGLIAIWALAMAKRLRHRGTLTLFVNAASLSETVAALCAAGCGSHAIVPLWPRAGREAKLVIVQAVRGGKGPIRMLPGLVLHGDGQGYTEAAQDILRRAERLAI
jgi:tRNA1(Val) A37 N6-methylase TrmN6